MCKMAVLGRGSMKDRKKVISIYELSYELKQFIDAKIKTNIYNSNDSLNLLNIFVSLEYLVF